MFLLSSLRMVPLFACFQVLETFFLVRMVQVLI